MNRQTKQLLALAGVLAVGLGAYAALRVWNAGEEEREPEIAISPAACPCKALDNCKSGYFNTFSIDNLDTVPTRSR